jgi:type I restriction enzyme S subunit
MNNPDWECLPLEQCIASINAGVSVNSEDRPRGSGEIGVLKTSAISNGSFLAHENKVVVAKDRLRVAEPLLGGSVLFSRMNTPSLVGESCYVESDDHSLFLPDRLWQIRVESSRVNARWLAYALQSPRVSTRIKALATGTSGSMKNISKKRLLAFEITVPPLVDQVRSAEALDALDDQIVLTAQRIQKLDMACSGLISDLLIPEGDGQHRMGGLTNTRTRPLVRLDSIATVERGKFGHRPRNDPKYLNGPFPFIQTGDITAARGGYIDAATQSLSSRGAVVSREFPAGTIAVTIAANIADTAILGRPMYFPDSVVGVSVAAPNNVRFVELVIRSAKRRLEARAPQSAQKNINLQDLRPLQVPLPSPERQSKIADVYESIATATRLEIQTLNKLKMLKQGLMADLLSGHVRVPAEVPA